MLMEANKVEELDEAIKKHEKIIVEFSSPTCVPCKSFHVWAEEITKEHPEIDIVIVHTMNDVNNFVDKYGVEGSFPEIRFYENGELKDTIFGWERISMEEAVFEEWYKFVKIFLMDFKEDIYNFARVGDRVIELKIKNNSETILPIKDKVFKLKKMWTEDDMDARLINEAIAPRKIGVTRTPVTKWLITEIKEGTK